MGNEVSQEAAREPGGGVPSQPPNPSQPRTGCTPVSLRWPHGGKTAYICGSFTHWQKMPMQWRHAGHGGEWFKTIDLPVGTHQYKFIVDGQWRHDHTAPTVLDNLGNVNNCIQVQAGQQQQEAAGAAGGDGAPSAAGGPAAAEGSAAALGDAAGGSGEARARAEIARVASDPYNIHASGAGAPDSYSQVVPPRDELLVHHSASLLLPPQLRLLLPHHHGDATTMPLIVQMNHAFCHTGDEFSIFAMSHRFREKSVTQFLYKPNLGPRRRPSGAETDAGSQASSAARGSSTDVCIRSVRISGTQRQREGGVGNEYVTYSVDSMLEVHGVQTTLRSERRYKHFNLLDQLLRKEFGPLVPQALPAKRPFGNLHPTFVEERRIALERYLQLCVGISVLAASSAFCNFAEADVPGSGGIDFERADAPDALPQSLHRVCSKQAYLLKRGRRVASWKRRFFCLCDAELYYYYAAEMSNPFQPLGVITLHDRDTQPKSDSAGAVDVLADGPPPPPRSPVIVESLDGDSASGASESLPGCFLFAVHTPGRTWHLAADSMRERSDWIRVLCACGAQFSACGAAAPPPPVPAWEPPAGAAGAADEGQADAAIEGMHGALWKRASKVHLTAGSETGQARDWVTRRFDLNAAARTLSYRQSDEGPRAAVRGVVPLAAYAKVVDAAPPQESLPHAFMLLPKEGGAERGIVLAANSENERAAWISAINGAIGDSRGVPGTERQVAEMLAVASIAEPRAWARVSEP